MLGLRSLKLLALPVVALVALFLVSGTASGGVNGDGNLDAVFAERLQRNQACLGDGMGTFVCSDMSSSEDNLRGVALGLVDSDTNLDAIFASISSITPNLVCLGDGGAALIAEMSALKPTTARA